MRCRRSLRRWGAFPIQGSWCTLPFGISRSRQVSGRTAADRRRTIDEIDGAGRRGAGHGRGEGHARARGGRVGGARKPGARGHLVDELGQRWAARRTVGRIAVVLGDDAMASDGERRRCARCGPDIAAPSQCDAAATADRGAVARERHVAGGRSPVTVAVNDTIEPTTAGFAVLASVVCEAGGPATVRLASFEKTLVPGSVVRSDGEVVGSVQNPGPGWSAQFDFRRRSASRTFASHAIVNVVPADEGGRACIPNEARLTGMERARQAEGQQDTAIAANSTLEIVAHKFGI